MVEGVEGRFVDLGQMDDASFKASTWGHKALKLPLALLQKRTEIGRVRMQVISPKPR